jgi:SAM-dependent methyltransferase
MNIFREGYSSYYDLFYADKDYVAESAFVREVIHRHVPSARSVLEFGCGSARHAVEFARSGLSVTGIDRSADMIARGHARIEGLLPDLRDKLTLMQGDATTHRSTATHDVVVSLFHVVSYQATNAALNGIFSSARAALAAGGLFVFDFWYGPAVLTDRPQVRVKRICTSHVHLTRIAEPEHHVNDNVVDVTYTLISVDQRTGRAEQSTELHSMRYLFLPEIELLAMQNGFEVVEAGEWLTGRSLHKHCWSGFVAARVTGDRQ